MVRILRGKLAVLLVWEGQSLFPPVNHDYINQSQTCELMYEEEGRKCAGMFSGVFRSDNEY